MINIVRTALPCPGYLLSPRAIYGSLASPNGSTPTDGSLGNILHAEGVRAAHDPDFNTTVKGTFHFSRGIRGKRFQTAVLSPEIAKLGSHLGYRLLTELSSIV